MDKDGSLVAEKDPSKLLEKLTQLFDNSPYPRIPLEKSPQDNPFLLYYYSLVTYYYRRNKQIISSEGKTILDVGCGTGYTTLMLAEANPGAKIIGIDISAESIDLAEKRLQYHGFKNYDFKVISLEDLPKLGMKFDYINSDEVLYIIPDPLAGLKAMGGVLKPDGIIRTNLHSYFQRFSYYRCQSAFKMMGLMNDNPGEMEIDIIREIFKSLRDGVKVKQKTWDEKQENDAERFLMNYLLQGDKGYTIPQMFAMIRDAGLEFISMVRPNKWELTNLFKEPNNLPSFLAYSLPEVEIEDKLHLFELLHPEHRLLDFLCGHQQTTKPRKSVDELTDSEWQQVKIHLHPLMKSPKVKQAILSSIEKLQPFVISNYFPFSGVETLINYNVSACIYPPLLKSPQPLEFLVKRWQKLYPENPLTGEAVTEASAVKIIRKIAIEREAFGDIILETNCN